MNNSIHAKTFVRSMKGSAAQIILAFLFARKAMDVEELRKWTNLKRETIYNTMPILEGFISKQVLPHGRAVYVPGADLLPVFQMMIDTTEAPQLQESAKRTSGTPTTTTELILNSFNNESIAVVVESQESAKRTSGGPQLPAGTVEPTYESHDASFEKNWEACRKANIGQPKRTEIALMAHVHPRLIADHIKSLRRGENIGLAIRRIESDEVPRNWIDEIETIEKPTERIDEEGDLP